VNDSTEIDLLLTREYADCDGGLFESDDVYIVAGYTTLNPRQLAILAYCGSSKIRARIAENPATPLWLLYHLSQDEDPSVRAMLAENVSVPMQLLESLAQDKSCDVRFTLAENPKMPLEILQILLEDENPYVASRAGKTVNCKLRNAKLDNLGVVPSQYRLLPPRHLRALEAVS